MKWLARDRSRPYRREDGFTLIFVALMLVVMLLFTAFAVDFGSLYSERRDDQNSADASATSGAVQFLTTQTSQGAVDEILAKVNFDLGRTVSTTDWTSCTDGGALAHTAKALGLNPATACVSFSSTFNRLRVKLPDQTVTTSFARIVGINQFTSSAFAEVTLQPVGGGALPFVVLANNGAGDQVCLRTDGTGGSEPPQQPAEPPYTTGFTQDPCDKASFATAEGGRGTLLPWEYDGCKQVGNQPIVDSIMVGMDHQLGVFNPAVSLAPGATDNLDSDPGARIDGGSNCTVTLPNSVAVDTGFTAQLLHCALLERPCTSGSASTATTPGRVSVASTSGATFTSLGVDDNALWNYFVSSLPGSAPASCSVAKSSATEFYLRRAALMDCLKNWTSGQLFTEAISGEARLGFVPKVAELGLCKTQPNPAPPAGGCGGGPPPAHVHVNSFAPVYIDGLYEDKGGVCDSTNPAFIPPTSTWAIHYPGRGLKCGSPGGKKVNRVSGIVVPCGSLPSDVCDPSHNPPFPDPVGIARIRLAR